MTAAQALMDQQLSVRWDRVLDEFVQQVNPIQQPHFQDYGLDYYWSVYQSEWASDPGAPGFRDAADLARLYPRLAPHGIETFDSGDVMRFLGMNHPKDFKVYRSKGGQTDGPPGWHPLRKSVADISRRAEVSQKANQRYLEALAAVDDTRSLSVLRAACPSPPC